MEHPLRPPGQFMPMADILSLTSMDAEAANERRIRHGLPPIGTTVADILPAKQLDIDHDRERYAPVELSMRMRGLTVPIGVCDGYLTNGLHRVCLAVRAGWAGMHVTCDFMATTDFAWNDANPGSSWT
jgi:hypothetical protein